ncbi:MAG: F-box protein, partial [bacterium]
MKKIVVGLGILLTISLSCFSTVTASNPDPDTDTAIGPIHLLPQNVLSLVIGNLPLQDFFQAARVCKGWHLARENAVPYSAREEGVFMLHDDHRWSDHLCESALVKTTSFFYETDGFAFVPFSQRTFPQGSVRLSDEDVAPFFDTLYAHAFGAGAASYTLYGHTIGGIPDTLSPQDLLCLKGVLPWSRMIYNPKREDAKSDALTFLTKTSQNKNLVRLIWGPTNHILTPVIRTLVFTTEEARDYALTSDLFFTNRDHKIHLVAEEGELLKNGILDTCHTDHHLRHLVISDPNE